jgi:hypothetical protein
MGLVCASASCVRDECPTVVVDVYNRRVRVHPSRSRIILPATAASARNPSNTTHHFVYILVGLQVRERRGCGAADRRDDFASSEQDEAVRRASKEQGARGLGGARASCRRVDEPGRNSNRVDGTGAGGQDVVDGEHRLAKSTTQQLAHFVNIIDIEWHSLYSTKSRLKRGRNLRRFQGVATCKNND